MYSRNRLARVGSQVLMVGAVVASTTIGVLEPAGAASAADPAAVAVRGGWFGLEKQPYGACLDSNASGNVYALPCQVPGNKYQDWDWTEWKLYSPYQGYYYVYSIKDEATGRCLDSNAKGQIYTSVCQAPGNAYQTWYWGPSNTPGMEKFTDVATGLSIWYPGEGPVETSTQEAYLQWTLIQ